MHYTTSGYENVAVGGLALGLNRTGWHNVAIGEGAAASTFAKSRNTAVGYRALSSSEAENNTALGAEAGAWTGFGGNNIYIGAGVKGDSGDANAIFIGAASVQQRTFIAGIRGRTTGLADAVPVVIDSAGQLGTISSSRRFKEDIRDMGDISQRLMQLRPVTFHYRQHYGDGSKPIQFGLVAEEVAETFPELAVRDSSGTVETVHYETLNVLMLNELQRQQRRIEALEEQVRQLMLHFTAEAGPRQ